MGHIFAHLKQYSTTGLRISYVDYIRITVDKTDYASTVLKDEVDSFIDNVFPSTVYLSNPLMSLLL